MTTIFRNARVFDGVSRELRDGLTVVVSDGRIQSVSESPVDIDGATVIDCKGRTLLPGLIDAHVHIVANSVDLSAGKQWLSFVHAQAHHIIEGMLARGFTTVRDGGGAEDRKSVV